MAERFYWPRVNILMYEKWEGWLSGLVLLGTNIFTNYLFTMDSVHPLLVQAVCDVLTKIVNEFYVFSVIFYRFLFATPLNKL